MPIKAKIKIPDNIPWKTECKLVNQGDFRIFARRRGHWIIFEKAQKPKFDMLINGELPEAKQNELRDRCTRIVDLYVDPDAFADQIRGRIERLANVLPYHQQKFVMKWLEQNVGLGDD